MSRAYQVLKHVTEFAKIRTVSTVVDLPEETKHVTLENAQVSLSQLKNTANYCNLIVAI